MSSNVPWAMGKISPVCAASEEAAVLLAGTLLAAEEAAALLAVLPPQAVIIIPTASTAVTARILELYLMVKTFFRVTHYTPSNLTCKA